MENKRIKLSEVRPNFGQKVAFKSHGESDSEADTGSYEYSRYCVLGPPMGSHGEGFVSAFNNLPCHGDLWMDMADFTHPDDVATEDDLQLEEIYKD